MLDENIDKSSLDETAANDNTETPKVDSEVKTEGDAVVEKKANAVAEEVQEETSKEVENNTNAEGKKPVIDETSPETLAEEKVQKEEKIEIPLVDHEKFTMDELYDAIQDLYNKYPIQDIKNHVETLKSDFINKSKAFIADKKEAFIAEGGDEIDFRYDLPIKKRFNDLMFEYKKKRQQFYKDIESSQKKNLEIRLQLIERLKDLIDKAEGSSMYKNFRSLQEEWRASGQIPHANYKDVWNTYHHHVERFYKLLHLNNDLRDLDFKHNLEEKTKLVEKAETLAKSDDVNHAFKELQILHRLWKEDIGLVARELRDGIWDRFSAATKIIHDKRHEHQEELEAKRHGNIALKLAVVEKIKAINVENITSHKLWQDNIKQLETFRNEFFKIGRVPKAKNEEIWQLFKNATRDFNKAKNVFYKNIKNDQFENLEKKLKLIEKAEDLKDSEDWTAATDVFKKIQADWKKIGHVPRKDSDKIWKQFKGACNHFFGRLHNKQNEENKELEEVYTKKKEYLEQFKEKIEKDASLTLETVNNHINEWKTFGAVPVKMRYIEAKFNKALDAAYKKLNIDKSEAELLKFKNLIDSYIEQKEFRKIDGEIQFIRRKVDESVKEIKQLENNLSFFKNASADNPLVKNVYENIEKFKKELKVWKSKLDYYKKLDY